MAIYERKPKRVNAVQWTGTNNADVADYFTDQGYSTGGINLHFDTTNQTVSFDLWDTTNVVNVGEWIVAPISTVESGIMTDTIFQDLFQPMP